MVEVKYRVLHVPELCECDYHQKVHASSENTLVRHTLKEAMGDIIKWNSQTNCWNHVILEIKENVYDNPKKNSKIFW